MYLMPADDQYWSKYVPSVVFDVIYRLFIGFNRRKLKWILRK